MPDGTQAISARGLRKAYGEKVAVNSLDLNIAHGEVFALLGPNGAGKTTTIEMLTGEQPRTSGQLQVLGRDPWHAGAAHRATVGVVSQGRSEFDDLRVAEVLTFFAGYYPQPFSIPKLLAITDLAETGRALVRTLSGGQRRRLEVALGIVGRPRLLFLDEPTVGLDPVARRDFWRLIRDLAHAATTIVLTTHYLQEAEALADRVGVLADGELVAVAPPADLGGRATAQTTVSWTEGGASRHITTECPTRTVQELADRLGGEIPDLVVARPSLEDIYLTMIGADR